MAKQALRLLGSIEVEWTTGAPPRFRSLRAQALLGYLVVERRPIPRNKLAALFWPDRSLADGRSALRRELHNLTKVLPDCWEIDRKSAEFAPDGTTKIDLDQIRQLEEREEWLETADLIRGDFLEGLHLDDNIEFETWLLGERERWRQRAERALRRAVEEKVSAGDDTEALHYARRLLQLLPWHEEMHRQVMTLLAQRGQRSAALQQYEQCKQMLKAELGVEVSAETQALYERIRDSTTFALHNIPAPTTPLIGREEELALLKGWLADPDVRLITISGPGGMGKTRLALGLAQDYLDNPAHPFTDGLYFVSLAALNNPSHILSTLAAALRFPFRRRDRRSPLEQLLDYLRQKKMLLTLDNFEHLMPAVGLVTDILKAAPGVQVLITSRERLRLQGEQVLSLEGLAHDEETVADTGSQKAAAELFLAVAGRVQPGFKIGDGDGGRLNRICRLVEGMPLALELAATWADTLPLATIASEIEQGLGFLETELNDVPQRHRSMEAILDTAWQRLSPQEQAAFARLSVFRGGFTLDAAEAVAGVDIKLVSRLINRSLLHYRQERDRYEIHELFRQYAGTHLKPAKSITVQRHHLDYFIGIAERVKAWQENSAKETNQKLLELEFGNFQAALDWSLRDPDSAHRGLRLAVELEWFWKLGGHFEAGGMWLTQLLAAADSTADPGTRARALRVAGDLELNRTGDRERTKALFSESLAIQRRLDDEAGLVSTLSSLGHMEIQFGDIKEAGTYLREAQRLALHWEDSWSPPSLLLFVGLVQVALADKDLKAARSIGERGLTLAKEIGSLFNTGSFLRLLSWVAAEERDWQMSRTYLTEALSLYQNMEDRDGIAHSHRSLGELARCEEQYELAEIHYVESLNGYRELGALPKGIAIDLFNLGQTNLVMGRIEKAVGYFQECLTWGQQTENLSLIHEALEGFANASSAQQHPLRAARLWGAAARLREKLDRFLHMPDQLAHDRFTQVVKKQIGEHTFQAAWAEGREMPLEQAIAYAQEFSERPIK